MKLGHNCCEMWLAGRGKLFGIKEIGWSGREDLNLRPPGPELKKLFRINNL